jgi:hypothetical protein
MRHVAGVALVAALGLAGCEGQVSGLLDMAGGDDAEAVAAPAGEEEAATAPGTDTGEQAAGTVPVPGGRPTGDPEAVLPEPELMTALEGSAVEADEAFAVAYDAPQIYMAVQPDAGGPTSVILAIDQSRDNTPSDDPAVRLTPDDGKCNPQQLRYYNFPPELSQRPVYGPDEAFRGITARELPDFVAMAVTAEMLEAGLIDDPEQSQPQNVCTRKLLQWVIIENSTG